MNKNDQHSSETHIVPTGHYFLVFAVLLILLAATIGVAYLDLGRLNLAVAMAISAAKTALVILFFMHIRYAARFPA